MLAKKIRGARELMQIIIKKTELSLKTEFDY